jgi:lysophospholipase L1-like esterase
MPAATTVYLFAGNGLTEGIYGEGYVERVAEVLHQEQIGLRGRAINAGRGAETIQSLLNRIGGALQEYQPHWVILAIGGNDVWLPWLSRHSLGWWLWFRYRRIRFSQKATTDLDRFAALYRALIDRVQGTGARTLACTVSPLGEQLTSPPNRQLARLNGVIKQVAADRQVPVADVWQAFVDELAVLPKPSRRVPGEWLLVWLDRRRLRTRRPDQLAERRGLHLTFDGIHLNSRGADLWAATILTALVQAQAPVIAPEGLSQGAIDDVTQALALGTSQ